MKIWIPFVGKVDAKKLFVGYLLFIGKGVQALTSGFPKDGNFETQEKWISTHPNSRVLRADDKAATIKYSTPLDELPPSCQLIAGATGFLHSFPKTESCEPKTILGTVSGNIFIPLPREVPDVGKEIATKATSSVSVRISQDFRVDPIQSFETLSEEKLPSHWGENLKRDEMAYLVEGNTPEGSCYVSGRASADAFLLFARWGRLNSIPPNVNLTYVDAAPENEERIERSGMR